MKKNFQVMMLFALVVAIFSSCEKDKRQEPQNEVTSFAQKAGTDHIDINILLNTPITNSILNNLGAYGSVKETMPPINALTMVTTVDSLSLIKNLSYVKEASEDAESEDEPVKSTPVTDFTGGVNMWNLDAINVTDYNVGRTISENGQGVYIGVIDEGLTDSWRQYFPEDRIAVQYAKCFGKNGTEQPGKWEHATHPHGLFVTSIILGFRNFFENGQIVNGVAPKANIIPVKASTQNDHYFVSAVTRGIMYMAELKAGVLMNSPVIINISLRFDPIPMMQAAIDYAISKGVIIVACAGNEGESGMTYPAAYQNVISAGSVCWRDQFVPNGYIFWWKTANIAEPTKVQDFYVSCFSSRQKPGQDLDVLAPADWIIGPWEINSGQLGYYFQGGTSLASPTVAGIVALMAQKKPSLTAAEAESILVAAAKPMGAGSATVIDCSTEASCACLSKIFTLGSFTTTWGTDATGAGLITADAALKLVK